MSARSTRRRPAGPGGSARNARLRADAAARQAAARRRRLLVLAAVAVAAVVVVALAVVLGQRPGGGGAAAGELVVPQPVPAAERAPQPLAPGRPVLLGGGDGARTLTVWADFSCPHCADFATGYRDVLHEAVAAGHVRLELAPLTFVQPPASVRAGNAFACATEAGFGPAYHDALFASWRADWDDEVLLALAEQVSPGLPESFTRCVRDTGAQSYLDSVDAASRTAGVEATPTVLLDGAPLDLATTTPASLAAQLQETP